MKSWQDIRDQKLKERDEKLKPFSPKTELPSIDELNDVSDYIDKSDVLSNDEKVITNYSIIELIERYRNGTLNVEEVTRAYCCRLAVANELVNCITEVRFNEALEEAKEEDRFFKRTGKLVGPLHGVIVTLKDNIRVSGLATSMGFIGLSESIEAEDSPMAKLIKDLGGIILGKSNTSAGMMYSESTNMLWGRTLNPYSRKYLNVGGSSGGEGAIAALKGSCFGIGSDIGGSVRHPAALNNVYSIKPSFGRLPCFGTASGQPGQESVRTVYGILSKKLDNVKYVLQQIVDAKPYKGYDATCLPIDFRPYILPQRKLRIAFLDTDGLSTATPPVLRGLQIVKDKLKFNGHIVIDWPDLYLKDIREAIYPFYDANGFQAIFDIIKKSGEPVDKLLSRWFPTARDMNVSELWKLQIKRTELAQKYMELCNGYFSEGKIDAIITYSSPLPACLINGVVPLPCTAIWNGLDYAASTFPVTRCDPKVDIPIQKKAYISECDEKVHTTYKESLHRFAGGPVALQVVCGRLEEEKCLELTNYISSLI
ncbi:amdS [Brettanomyces bruxellensis]|uniref:DEBR0S3_14642g1_1 n=1 Tax=Dekkera bruxellensis TaxID=5007 RepID=A0A7D9H0B0_DEKBR|nr:amdS [Brettanomyces bruxellensis]